MSNDALPPHVQARIAAIEEALARRAMGQTSPPNRDDLYRPPTRGATALPQELAWRDTLTMLVETLESPEMNAQDAALMREIWDHLTRTDANGYSLCFDGPLRQDLLARLHRWMDSEHPELLDRYAELWTPRPPVPTIQSPQPRTPPPPPQGGLFHT